MALGKKVALTALGLLLLGVAFPQKFDVGIHGAMTLSKPVGMEQTSKWSTHPGSAAGFDVRYSFLRNFALNAGVEYASLTYNNKSFRWLPSWYSSIWYPYPYGGDVMSGYTFIRLPLMAQFQTNTAVNFSFGFGVFYGFMQSYSQYRETFYECGNSYPSPYPYPVEKPQNDFGVVYSAAVDYPITDKIALGVQFKYYSGREGYVNSLRGGSAEIGGYLRYNIFGRNGSDTSKIHRYFSVNAGVGVSSVVGSKLAGDYSPAFSGSQGFELWFSKNDRLLFGTGFRYEQLAYRLSGISDSYYVGVAYPSQTQTVDNLIQINYLTFPINLRYLFGSRYRPFIDVGAYLSMRHIASCRGYAYKVLTTPDYYHKYKTTINDQIDNVFKEIACGFSAGCGLLIPLKNNHHIQLAVQYRIGAGSIINEEVMNRYIPSKYDDNIKMSSALLSVAYIFPY